MHLKILVTTALLSVFTLFTAAQTAWAVTGFCVNCHTMHNSQDGLPIDTGGQNSYLTTNTCIGCHAQGTAANVVTIAGSDIPQVFHTNATDLAGGNFAYIDGTKGGVANASFGHNIVDLFGVDSDGNIDDAPGFGPHASPVSDSNLTCSGRYGCHGTRNSSNVGIKSLKGSHHNNADGSLTVATTVANSYRFLYRVKGYENTVDPWRNVDANSHNEYFGATTPMADNANCANCHSFAGAAPASQTISGFCSTCHGSFHDIPGIGGNITSPFVRHPTDILIPNDAEYSAYTGYSVLAPPGRPIAGIAGASNTVTPGTDMVTCISCHVSHASQYPDMLRWDYTTECISEVGDGARPNCGCFVCHTLKDD